MSNQQPDRFTTKNLRNPSEPYLDRADIVIIGNGIAGLTAAVEARRLEPDKSIVIVTDQTHPTINTPALKQFAIAKLDSKQLLANPAGAERAERIHIVNARVSEIHARSNYLFLGKDRHFGYETLLIATGSRPMGLPEDTPGRNFDGVMTLHRLQDYLDFRRRIPEVSDAVVIGGGVHAIETVMGLLYWNIRVTWLIRGHTIMPNMLDQNASEMVLRNIMRAGATVDLETEVMGIVGRMGTVAGVITNREEFIPSQLVLMCTGTQPVMDLAQQCSVPIQHKKGILVDDKLRTSVRNIYAAGDVAALRNPQTGTYEPRAQWYAAGLQGRIAGAMMAGHTDLARQPFGVPWHATHLGELSMLTVGEPLKESRKIETLTDVSQGNYRRLTILDDRLVGYLSLGNAQPDSLAIKRIIDEGHSIREVTKALLKGNFDAREYLSKLRTRATRGVMTGQLTPTSVPPLPIRSGQPDSRSLTYIPGSRQTNPLAQPQLRDTSPIAPARQRETNPLASPAAKGSDALPQLSPAQSMLYEQEVSPFSGNLPEVGRGSSRTRKLSSDAQPALPVASTMREVDELSAFTGNLPTLSRQRVESRRPTDDTADAHAQNKLWSYLEK